MLTAEAIEKIVEIGSSELVVAFGLDYAKTSEGVTLVAPPQMECIECFSLTQLISFLKAQELFQNNEGEPAEIEDTIINPVSHIKVLAFETGQNEIRKYDYVASADFSKVFEDFPDGTHFSQEDLIIKLQAMFMQTPERDELLKLVQKVSTGRTIEGEDDGVAQQVAVKAGVHLQSQVKVRNPWILKPFKSFPEITPVDVPYVLRLHQRGDSLPNFSLHEADGGKWKVETTKAVRKWLQDQVIEMELKKVTVL